MCSQCASPPTACATRASTSVQGRPCSLSESGLSVTRPGGEGMEWHADGTDGEATVLVSLADVSADLGCLGMIPGSHAEYNPDKARMEI